ncbi:MAG: hypothetical protein GC204_00920 [Chloroflexi bacterium]|nr:hypothetical protein [Chloroflexota bacterium]
MELPAKFQTVIDRFVSACTEDDRVIAGCLTGSYARGAADSYSDIDLDVIISDDAFEDFCADRRAFIARLGEALLFEDFDNPQVAFFIFPDDAEGELVISRESLLGTWHAGTYKPLVDKKGLLKNGEFHWQPTESAAQTETLRRQIFWFWHDLSHFITAMGRQQLWWAHGQIEILRLMCVNLAHLRHDFAASPEGYDKVELYLPVEQLAPLQSTFCPLEYAPLLQAGLTLVQFYRELAPALASTHGIAYPLALEGLMLARLEKLRRASTQEN